MSNQNIIFAIAKDTNQGAKSLDGSSWSSSNLAATNEYRGLSGVAGKFMYLTYDPLRRYSINDYAIVDSSIWHPGTLPAPQTACVVAIAENATTLFYSYDGQNFIKGPESV